MTNKKPVKTLFVVDVQNLWYGARELLNGGRVDYTALRRTAKQMFPCTDIHAVAYVVSDSKGSNESFKEFLKRIGYEIRDMEMGVTKEGDTSHTNWNSDMIKDVEYFMGKDNVYQNFIVASGDGAFSVLLEKYAAKGRLVGVIAFRDSFNKAIIDHVNAVHFLGQHDCFNRRRK